MIDIDAALALVLERALPLPPQQVDLPEALGRILAESIRSDVDSPPHAKSLVDGYAIRSEDLAHHTAEFEVLEEVTAGALPTRTVTSRTATRIMTGAPIPAGSDAVVMVEDSEIVKGHHTARQTVRLTARALRPGQNIMPRAAALRQGETVLRKGHWVRPVEIGLLAEIGAARVSVHPQPSVAILATGDELVSYLQKPGAGQIRNSNSAMLDSLVQRAGSQPVNLGIVRDQREELARLIGLGLESHVLVLSGGVSAGVLDLVPSVLEQLGVQPVFHRVRLKPGKPLWFGVLPATPPRLVFGLPGNPVSSLVCFELFVRPALQRLAGKQLSLPSRGRGTLSHEFAHRGNRPTFHPAVISPVSEGLRVAPLDWKGSADLRTLVDANGWACFPEGDRQYAAGEEIEIEPWDV